MAVKEQEAKPAPSVDLEQGSRDREPSDKINAGKVSRQRLFRHALAIASLFGIFAFGLLSWGIRRPAGKYYDEAYFVTASKMFLQDAAAAIPEDSYLGKPPLARLLMAMGIKAAGDNALGWRVAGISCGALTIVAIFLWTYFLLDDLGIAAFAAALALVNNFFFVMSRIAMLDAYLLVFLTWSLVCFTAAVTLDLDSGKRRLLFIASGILTGLAQSCKWNAIDTLAVFFVVSFGLPWLARRVGGDGRSSLLRSARNLHQIGLPTRLVGLTIIPAIAYGLTFWPLCGVLHQPFSFHEFLHLNKLIWQFNHTAPTNPSIATRWYTWPLRLSPQRSQAYLMGNPVVTWGGLAALGLCLWRFCKSFAFPEGLVLLLYSANLLQWAITPERGTFYYYYYPCVTVLGVAIAMALRTWPDRIFGARISVLVLVAAAVIFLWCYPRMADLDAPWDCALGCWS
jgi:dolichyl-phosphate-mannose--protein O-mannosyl transferase